MQRSAAVSGGAIGIMSGRATDTWFGGWALAKVFAAYFRKSQCHSVPEGVGGGGIVMSFSCGRGPRLAGAKARFVVRRANFGSSLMPNVPKDDLGKCVTGTFRASAGRHKARNDPGHLAQSRGDAGILRKKYVPVGF